MSAGKYECVGCGARMDGGTFLCLTAWCAACYARIGKAAIIAAADEVEAQVNEFRARLLATKFRFTDREALTPWGKTPAEQFRDRHCAACLGACPWCKKEPNEPHREGCAHVCTHVFQQYAPASPPSPAPCFACRIEAEIGTEENPHPVPARFHTCTSATPRCDCCGHAPHDDRETCGHPEPKWANGKCGCAGSTYHPTKGYNGRAGVKPPWAKET